MSASSDERSNEFLGLADQFRLGGLVTEASHPGTASLSETARGSAADCLRQLFEVDRDVLRKYAEIAATGRLSQIARTLAQSIRGGGKVFFTGCGSTGRLSIQLVSIWRDFWQRQGCEAASPELARDYENRAFSVMAGGDFALIKAVEGFEDFTAFGKRQIRDLGVSAGDVVFAITEGGETSFVIGTAWEGLDSGAKVFFVYNNPDDVLCARVERSREVIQDHRIEKINLTTGPMAITGSTRMQATSIQLAVMLTILERVVRELSGRATDADIEGLTLSALESAHQALCSPQLLEQLAALVSLEEEVYRNGRRNNYFASAFAIDVLTDTTERSPTYCTPPFRKFDDTAAAESWAYLFVPSESSPAAWEFILKRAPKCVEWTPAEVLELVGPEKAPRTNEIIARISHKELMRFRVGKDGISSRPAMAGGSAVCIMRADEASLLGQREFFGQQLLAAKSAGARTAVICAGAASEVEQARKTVQSLYPETAFAALNIPATGLLLDAVTRVSLKLLLNALSTCAMVRLGRVMGNYMIWVVASNLKLIDRATRYIQQLAGLDYKAANRLLFESVEYVEPRMRADKAYPPVVGLSVIRAKYDLDLPAAEARLREETQARSA